MSPELGRMGVTGQVCAKLFWLRVRPVSVDMSHILVKGVLKEQSPEKREKQNRNKNQTSHSAAPDKAKIAYRII